MIHVFPPDKLRRLQWNEHLLLGWHQHVLTTGRITVALHLHDLFVKEKGSFTTVSSPSGFINNALLETNSGII